MHTAYVLKQEMFEVEVNGDRASREALFSAARHERIGVVVTSPLGGFGASLMIQLGITAYYNAPNTNRYANPHYPEVYFFHAGGSFGDYSLMDAWPARKQIFLSNDGDEILASLNSHAITHLLVPDEAARDAVLGFTEPNAALDRLEKCFLYDPSGRTRHADIAIRALDRSVLKDVDETINLREALDDLVSSYPAPDNHAERRDNDQWIAQAKSHMDDVNEDERTLVLARRSALDEPAGVMETYREITPAAAVRLFGQTFCE
jgi:hypothetical protein